MHTQHRVPFRGAWSDGKLMLGSSALPQFTTYPRLITQHKSHAKEWLGDKWH
jgi:hypothetical protein